METIGHYVVTHTGSSWLVNQVTHIPRYRSLLFSWTSSISDAMTNGDQYIQIMPRVKPTPLARKLSLGAALALERMGGGITRGLDRLMRREGVRLIHAHFGRAGYYALPLAKRLEVPLVVSFYGYDVSEYPVRYPKWKAYYRRLFEQATCIVALGPFMAGQLTALGCPTEKLLIHHLGVDVNAIPFQPRQCHPGEPLRVLIAATFREKKGIVYALEALGRLKADIPIQITLVGDAQDHPLSQAEKQRILATIDQWELSAITNRMGAQPYHKLLELAQTHHVFLAPSVTASGDMEGTPMVLVDMAASGIPIISTVHADIPAIIKHGETGLLTQERDAEGLVTHLRWLVDHPELWEAMTRAGRTHVETYFDVYKQGDQQAQFYARLLA